MNLIEKALWQIETMLYQPLTLEELANRCAVSPFHLSRAFRSLTGYSVMAYVRARRLSQAAKVLATADVDILTIALDVQFGSHEAFTRAFCAYFGMLPSTVRKHRCLETLKTMEPFMLDTSLLVALEKPRILERKAFTVTGMTRRYSFEANGGIPVQWQSFNQRAKEVPLAVRDSACGVCHDADAHGMFSYLVGVESTDRGDAPVDMVKVVVPAGRYAVFAHVGHIADIRKTTYTIWNKALAEEELNVRQEPDFEVYDERFDPETGMGTVEIWIPVA